MRQDTRIGMPARGRRVCSLGGLAAAVAAALWSAPMDSQAAGGASIASDAVKFEKVEGSDAELVILTEKAAERIGVETGEIGQAPVVRRQVVGGLVIPPLKALPAPDSTGGGGGFGGFEEIAVVPVPKPSDGALAKVPDGEAWVLITLSDAEWERLATEKPARVLPLVTTDYMEADAADAAVLAQPTGFPPVEDIKRSMLSLYYVVPGKNNGVELNTRVRVELQQRGDGEVRKVAPYSAIYYDSTGTPWVYVVREPLVYQRAKVAVDHIMGDMAILSEGPEVGTQVVTVGAALLYGAEFYFRN